MKSCTPTVSPPESLSQVASDLVHHIPRLFDWLRNLQEEEAGLDGKRSSTLTRQLGESKPTHSTPPNRSTRTLPSQRRTSVSVDVVEKEDRSAHLDADTETQVKSFTPTESFSSAMLVKSKRKGMIFLTKERHSDVVLEKRDSQHVILLNLS
ncbi:hypothetical protein PAXRUDRAFT_365911 [Paxillus rubicundulus Ve08.2h10]|uniref:Uncharacterized protein n=1 Tax=Paxillus rubicundulus Ve08.2h10 TaxID=930991 RepID=A0A0D0E3V4_9AGAM|nr:hypothetical protein PAXRUDRAFT_365911 [Paxillus rubicundulus Ve08.2h10]